MPYNSVVMDTGRSLEGASFAVSTKTECPTANLKIKLQKSAAETIHQFLTDVTRQAKT